MNPIPIVIANPIPIVIANPEWGEAIQAQTARERPGVNIGDPIAGKGKQDTSDADENNAA